jgi:MFS family permease
MWALLPRKLKILLVTMIIANVGTSAFGPFMALYVKDLGADVGQVGLYFTIIAMSPVVFRILGGWVSDNLGRVQTVAIGSLAGLIAFTEMWLAPSWEWLIPGGLLMHLGMSLVGPSFRAYTAECADETMRAQVFGFTDSIFLICQIIGPPLGGYLAQAFGYRQLFAVATGLMVVATVLRVWNAWDLSFRLGQLKLGTLKSGLGGIGALILGGGLLTWIFLVDAARDFGFSLSFNFFSLYQKDIGGLTDGQIGWLSSVGSVTMVLLLTPSGRLSDRIGERKMMIIGGLVGTAGLLMFVNVRSFAGFVFANVLLHVTWALFGPAFDSLLSKAVPLNQLGLTYGIFASTMSVIAMPAPAIGAQLWESVSPRLPFYLTTVVGLVTLVPIWFRFKLPAQVDAAADETPVTTEAMEK